MCLYFRALQIGLPHAQLCFLFFVKCIITTYDLSTHLSRDLLTARAMQYARSMLVPLSNQSDPLFFFSTSQSFMIAIFTFDFEARLYAYAAAFYHLSLITFQIYPYFSLCILSPILSPTFGTVVGCSMPRVGCKVG